MVGVKAIKKNYERVTEGYFGLNSIEAEKRLNKYGLNTIVSKKKISPVKILISQFKNFMIAILSVSTVISALMGEITEAVTIMAIIFLNAFLGFIQEYKTEKTLEALKVLSSPVCRVVRDGNVLIIPTEEVVPGDLLLLEEGDRIPADAVLLKSVSMQVDESLLTGESVPVAKGHVPGIKAIADADESCRVYMGTVITTGRGTAIVTATGMDTEMGKIADMIQNVENDETPLQKRLSHLGRYIVTGCLVICAIVSLTGILRGEDIFDMLIAGISLAVAAVPEGLPAVVTVALAIGVQRMLKRNALVRKLPAVETLGCADYICSDKTGTLTENKMTLRKIWTADTLFTFEKASSSGGGGFFAGRKKIEPSEFAPLEMTLKTGVICNNSRIVREGNSMTVQGSPTETAIVNAVLDAGIDALAYDEEFRRIDEIPFDSERKCMSVICSDSKGRYFVFTKGAPDVIIKKCSRIHGKEGFTTMTPLRKAAVNAMNDRMAGEALRVLAVAFKPLEHRKYENESIEKDLIFIGLLGMIDPPRKEAYAAVQKCKMAGIRPVMITGDHRITAYAIARELDIIREGEKVLTGNDIDRMSEGQFQNIVESVPVFARVSPRHKYKIVKALKSKGHIIAMTGDGVNDAPAIKEADIGVSMGKTGTDVTKEASSMILMDDNFATIVAAVEEGRVIYNNIRKFIRYLLSCNIGEVLTMFLGMLIGLPVPLLPIQILWVNLVTDGLPAIALGLEPAEKDIMYRPPRKATTNIFSDGLAVLIITRGILLGLCTLGVYAGILYLNGNVDLARTSAFVTLVLGQLVHVFECKSEKKVLYEIPILNNHFLIGAVLCSLSMILSVVYVPVLQVLFKTVPLSLREWILICGFTLFGPAFQSLFGSKR